jgi:hypothetical protein
MLTSVRVRPKILLPLLTVMVLSAAAALYVATIGIKVDATRGHLVGRWTSGRGGTTILLQADGTFSATRVNDCAGPIQAVVDGDTLPSRLDVTRGEGTWSVTADTNNPRVDTFLNMSFRTPRRFTLRWQAGNVTWRFRSTAVTLISNNGDVDGGAPSCTFEADD